MRAEINLYEFYLSWVLSLWDHLYELMISSICYSNKGHGNLAFFPQYHTSIFSLCSDNFIDKWFSFVSSTTVYLSMLSNNSRVLLLCMCTYGSWVHVQVCVHECETSLLPEPGAHWCLTSKSQSHPVSTSQHRTHRCAQPRFPFSHGFQRLNSGPHACAMNTL